MASPMMWDLEGYRRGKWRSLSSARLFITPWTSSRGQITGVGSFFPSPADLPSPGIKPGLLNCRWILYQLSYSALLTMPKPLTVWITTNWKILKEMGIPDHLTCLLRNLYATQEATVRTGHGTTDLFQIGKGVHQGCILSPCLFNL